jgi:hypothetical protein
MAIFGRTADASSPTGWKLVKFREQVGARHYRHIAEKTLLIVEDDEFNFVYPIWPSNTRGANPVDNANRWYQTALGRHEVQTDFGPYLGTLEEKNASGYRGFGS